MRELAGRTAFAWVVAVVSLTVCRTAAAGEEAAHARVFHVAELTFTGPRQAATDSPARDVSFSVLFRHESGRTEHRVHGFWDADGKGGSSGDVFKVRFCPTGPGRWTLAEVKSSARELDSQRQGDYVTAERSDHPGFWEVDTESPGKRWYKRSDGSHPYVTGNTHYSFLSGTLEGGRPSGNDIARDVAANAKYFKKLRFALHGDRYPHPRDKPFLNDDRRPTDSGDFSHRPNPAWFASRVDVAVAKAFEVDLIADLILAGPDTKDARATLRAAQNKQDPTPYLRYIAARYGSYPNVWLCLCNEYNIREPKYAEREVAKFGQAIRHYLPYPTPLSVHASPPLVWAEAFDALPPWNDHQIVQLKLKQIAPAADVMVAAWKGGGNRPRNKPTINDELSYEGEGDRHSEADTVESHLGAFLGGGYASTGYKPGNKLGQYFWGNFDPAEHTSADNLKLLREVIDRNVTFWRMAPEAGPSIFENFNSGYRAMAWPGREYVLGTNKRREGVIARLPEGKWLVTRHDLMARESKELARDVGDEFRFDAPDSRAVLFHFKKL